MKVGLISLGCAKNLVDAEIMLGALLRDGVEITNDPRTANVVIVNTCSFIDAAQEESIDAILESNEVREAHQRGQGLVVSGCLPQRFRNELPKLLPEVDAFMGIDQVAQAGAIVRQALNHRQQRLTADLPGVESASKASKDGISSQLARIEARSPSSGGQLAVAPAKTRAAAHEPSDSLRGTARFGKTRQIVAMPKPLAPEAPILEVHARPTFIPDFNTPRFRLTPRHFAYVKIAEGCNHPCSFCIIPRMRGTHRSRPQSDIVAEARGLLAEGVRELNLISQDSTYYGLDLRPQRNGSIAAPEKFKAAARALPASSATLPTLLRELNELPGDFWIRLLYTHPAHWTDELIETIAACPKVARYVDMPLQHIHDNMLERMRRETSADHIVELIRRIRAGIPGIALRTTFIAGFPGETEACFRRLLEFIEQTRFERMGVFVYSKEEGTRAGAMAGQIPKRTAHKRRDLAMDLQAGISRSIARAQIGRELRVLVESQSASTRPAAVAASSWEHGLIRAASGEKDANPSFRSGHSMGRGEWDAPDIDGRVIIRGKAPTGQFAQVRITGHTDYDLIAEMANADEKL